jgi:hypothetical protein
MEKAQLHYCLLPTPSLKRDGFSGNGKSLEFRLHLLADSAALAILRLFSNATAAPHSITTPNTSRNARMKGICDMNANAMKTTPMSVNITALRECALGANAVRFLFRWTKAWTDLTSFWQASLHARPTPVSLGAL